MVQTVPPRSEHTYYGTYFPVYNIKLTLKDLRLFPGGIGHILVPSFLSPCWLLDEGVSIQMHSDDLHLLYISRSLLWGTPADHSGLQGALGQDPNFRIQENQKTQIKYFFNTLLIVKIQFSFHKNIPTKVLYVDSMCPKYVTTHQKCHLLFKLWKCSKFVGTFRVFSATLGSLSEKLWEICVSRQDVFDRNLTHLTQKKLAGKLFFFYNNIFYENIEAEICKILRIF